MDWEVERVTMRRDVQEIEIMTSSLVESSGIEPSFLSDPASVSDGWFTRTNHASNLKT
jgi:hypothetical protein